MKILAVGGGSGGHVTPVVAVLREIRSKHPKAEIRFWCDEKFYEQSRSIFSHFDENIRIDTIKAGKFRRYNHVSVLRQMLWFSVVALNIRDIFLVIIGFFQSFFKLIAWRPDVVFTKGGYVCLPVGIAVKLLGLPLLIHDSDAHPGLTNRILARWANKITTGAPLEYYNYPKERARYVGIPIGSSFKPFSNDEKISAKKLWGLEPEKPLVVITGGGLGAKRINDTVASRLKDLLGIASVVLVSGTGQYDELKQVLPKNDSNFQLHSFVSKNMAELLGAADVVVARAGATSILELAALAKPTILIPNGKLTGGHQLKNAVVYENSEAVLVIDENKMIDDTDLLVDSVKRLIDDKELSMKLSTNFLKFSKPNAAKDVADMIISCAK